MIIAKASDRDALEIARAVGQLVASSSFEDMQRFSESETVASVIDMIEHGTCFVMRNGQDFAGCFLGVMHPNLVSGDTILAEVFFWVEPQFRGHGLSLLRHAEAVAKASGCKLMALSHPASNPRAGKLYERQGYTLTELVYRKAL